MRAICNRMLERTLGRLGRMLEGDEGPVIDDTTWWAYFPCHEVMLTVPAVRTRAACPVCLEMTVRRPPKGATGPAAGWPIA